jgi:uncharacterized protein YkwD
MWPIVAGAVWLVLLLVLSLCRAAVAAPAEAEPCANRDVPFESAPPLARDALLCELDRVRRRHDEPRLRGDPALETAAQRHAEDMRRRGYFAHDSPGGGELRDRLRRVRYVRKGCSWRAGEVLAWGTGGRSTAAATVRAWLDSPSHRRVVLSGRYAEIGLGLQAGTPFTAGRSGVTVAAVLGDRDCS